MPPTVVQYQARSASFLLRDGPHIPVAIEGYQAIALLDTGARFSYIDLNLARNLRLPERGVHTAVGATGTATHPTFEADFQIPLLGQSLAPPVRALPLNEMEHFWRAIVGRDVLCHYELTIDWRNGVIRFVGA